MAELNRELLDALCGLLAQSDDFSMAASLRQLEEAKPLGGVLPALNPHTELTLKGNAENEYCRSHHFELAYHVYRKELAAFWDYVLARVDSGERAEWPFPPEFTQQAKRIEDEFYATPLPNAPQTPRVLIYNPAPARALAANPNLRMQLRRTFGIVRRAAVAPCSTGGRELNHSRLHFYGLAGA